MDSRLIEILDTLTVSHVKHLNGFTSRPEVKLSICHGAINVEDKQSDRGSGFKCHLAGGVGC
jgi:hypothetical protein